MEPPPSVVVYFDGAWEPPGVQGSEFWSYGFVVQGAGLEHRYGHATIVPRMANLLSAVIGPIDDPNLPMRTRCVIVADMEGALEALCYLKSEGFRGAVEMRGDSRELSEILQSGEPFDEERVDFHMLELRRRLIREVVSEFAEVRWVWVPREENREADALAHTALRSVTDWKAGVLVAAREHPERDPLGGLLTELVTGIMPGKVYRPGIENRRCECRTCAAEGGAAPPE
ncbi:MAG TPA: reverse transcriptase-like protein [Thermoplasmata archaeon]|nr:reverse transcriptase-like protein [Thermoplasmata archaeon]